MAKSSRSSAVKKNNQILKKKVFRPVEVARNERLSAKLLGLARQPKGLATEMEIDKDDAKSLTGNSETAHGADVDMSAQDDSPDATRSMSRSNHSVKKGKAIKAAKIEKKRHRKEKNRIVFKKHPMKPGKKSKR